MSNVQNEKHCPKCNISKLKTDFHKHSRFPDGLQFYCKECSRLARVKSESILKLNPLYREQKRIKERGKGRKIDKKYIAKWAILNPEKRKASNAIRWLKKTLGMQWHHWSYNEQHLRDVIQLTILDHKRLHRFLIYDKTTFLYRRKDTNELLDTRQKHEQFILHIAEIWSKLGS